MAQSLALGNDHAYIEPAHVLAAMLRQDDGPKALLQRAGVNVNVGSKKDQTDAKADWQMDIAEFDNAGCLVNGN